MSKHEVAESVRESADAVKDVVKEELIVLWEKLPSWQQDNRFIVSGYRSASGSYRKSAASLGYLHNETINIYTHLLGSIAFAIGGFVLWSTIATRYKTATSEDVYVFSCFFLGAVTCLGMSATYHTISNHSEVVSRFGNKLDYLGIVFLIWGSFIPSIYYGFSCSPEWISTYWTMITTIGAGCAVVCMHPVFSTSDWRPFRAAMFVMMGLSAVVPVIHGLQLYTREQMEQLIGLRWLLLQGFLYILGATIYAARIPERFKPGQFDLFGSSHQIFHILVVLAAMSHLRGFLIAFDTHHSPALLDLCKTT